MTALLPYTSCRLLVFSLLTLLRTTWAANSSEPALEHDCRYRLSDYNASGINRLTTWSPPEANSDGSAHLDRGLFHLAKTVEWNASDDTARSRLWFDPAGLNFSNDRALEMDACGWSFLPTENMVRLAQNDPGDCSVALSEACRNAITSRMDRFIQNSIINPSPGPNSNLTAGVMHGLCAWFGVGSGAIMPAECMQEFDDYGAVSKPLTGHNYSILTNASCMEGEHANQSFVPLTLAAFESQAGDYDKVTRNLDIVLLSFFPWASYERTSWFTPPYSTLQCSRVKEFARGSVVSPELPAGIPPSSGSSKLSHGAIAGTVIGSIAGACMLIGLTFWLCKQRKRRESAQNMRGKGVTDTHPLATEKDGTNVAELPEDQRKPELHERHIAELRQESLATELHEQHIVELPAGEDHRDEMGAGSPRVQGRGMS